MYLNIRFQMMWPVELHYKISKGEIHEALLSWTQISF